MKTFSALVLASLVSITAFANPVQQSNDRETYALSRTLQGKCSKNAETFILRKFQSSRPELKFDEVFCEGAFSRRNGKPYIGCMLYPEGSASESHYVALLDPTCRRSFATFQSKRD